MAKQIAEMLEESMVPMPAPIPEGLVPHTPQALLIEGGAATGKTQALVERAAELLVGGADARDVLVLCATPDAAAAFAARLAAACPAGAQARVTTARELALQVLATPQAQAATGRGARLLAPFEVDVLMEDVKTGGTRPGRLREMLRFFYKSITELCDWDEEWLVTGEEEVTYGLLQECLRFTGGILEPEVANTAARYLTRSDEARAAWAVPHVLVDDYLMLSRASQVLANVLAHESIAVATDPALCVEVFDSYPYAAGTDEFCAANPQVERRTLQTSFACGAAVRAVGRIAEAHGLEGAAAPAREGAPAGSLEELVGENPGLERDAVVEAVRAAIEAGVQPGAIAVAAPNGVWSRNLAAALEASGVPAERSLDPRCVSGDLRALDRCVPARVLTALYLVADPRDGVAWRSWCGFGDHFAASSAMASVRAFGAEAGLTVDAALEQRARVASEAGVNRAEHAHLEAACQSAALVLQGAGGLEGDELLRYLAAAVAGEGAQVPVAVRELTAPLAGDGAQGGSAAELAARARLRLAAPRMGGREGVRVCELKDLTGTSAQVLVLAGMVNGFFPTRGVLDREILVQEDADKQVAKDVRLLVNAVGKATQRLVASRFEEADLEVAERLKVKIGRIQLHGGRRVALTQPSMYLELMRD